MSRFFGSKVRRYFEGYLLALVMVSLETVFFSVDFVRMHGFSKKTIESQVAGLAFFFESWSLLCDFGPEGGGVECGGGRWRPRIKKSHHKMRPQVFLCVRKRSV
jgi:hypothetical protein